MTRSKRIRLGWFVALAYLFCVLAPAAALATGNALAPCLGEAWSSTWPSATTVRVHLETGADRAHDHGAMHDHAGMHAHQHTAAQDMPATHHHDGKNGPGPCCAMMCATALPADLPSVAKPVQPASVCAAETALRVHDEAPPLLYRPPIA